MKHRTVLVLSAFNKGDYLVFIMLVRVFYPYKQMHQHSVS